MNAEQLRQRISEIAANLRELANQIPVYEKEDWLKAAVARTKYVKLDNECCQLMMELDTLEGK